MPRPCWRAATKTLHWVVSTIPDSGAQSNHTFSITMVESFAERERETKTVVFFLVSLVRGVVSRLFTGGTSSQTLRGKNIFYYTLACKLKIYQGLASDFRSASCLLPPFLPQARICTDMIACSPTSSHRSSARTALRFIPTMASHLSEASRR